VARDICGINQQDQRATHTRRRTSPRLHS
jgi:hypothetical protein